jgi:cysteine-rich repeat protein
MPHPDRAATHRTHRHAAFVAVALGAALAWASAGGADAAVAPALRCASGKLGAVAKYSQSAVSCHAKGVKGGTDGADPACLDKVTARLGALFAKAETRSNCDTVGDAGALVSLVDTTVEDAMAALAWADDTGARRCAAAKLAALGKASKGWLACYARYARRGLGPDAGCVDKVGSKLATEFAKADAAGACTVGADLAAQQALWETAVTRVVAAVSPVCGDGIAGVRHACDGADDAACPGLCDGGCGCPAVCGNAVAEAGEECDDGGTADFDGCSAACELEDASALCAGVASSTGTEVAVEALPFTFNQPIELTAPALDPRRLFVAERDGIIRVIRDGEMLAEPFLDISALVGCCSGERGLLGLAFAPDYETSGRFFVHYSDNAGDTTIARYEVDPLDADVADPASAAVLLVVAQPFSNHNGGAIAFGADGYLYVGLGDGGAADDPLEAGQDTGTLLGKLLRLDVDVEGPPYFSVPASNPFYVDGNDVVESIWALGLRNPWRFSFDRATGDLYIADVGQNRVEEIDYQPAASTGGENYGWDIFEGDECFDDSDEPGPPVCPDPPTGFTFPVHTYSHGQGCSVSGGHVYRGCAMPDLAGTYFYSDFCAGWVRSFRVAGGVATDLADHSAELQTSVPGGFGLVAGFGQDARGELYILDLDGTIYRVVAP